MASVPPSRPSRRPRVAPAETDHNIGYPRDATHHIIIDEKNTKAKKTLKRPRKLSDGEGIGIKKARGAIEGDARPRAVQPRKLAGAGAVAKSPAKLNEGLTQRQTRREEGTGERVLPKYVEKASNGIKHELERLQPDGAADTKSETRKLRSQEGTRFKSELASYFPDYDVVIGNEAAEETRKFWMLLDYEVSF